MGGGFDPAALCVPGVRGLKPYEPGKPIDELERELGIADIVKVASNENPLGPSPLAIAAMEKALERVGLYPDGNAYVLKRALADYHKLETGNVTVGSGSDHILELVARAFLMPGRSAVMSRFGFSIYAIVARAAGAELRMAEAHPAGHPSEPYGHDTAAMLREIDGTTRVVFVANPNNPTGTWLRRAEIEEFLEQVPPHTLVVLDEAYYDYVAPFEPDYEDADVLLERFPNLIVTRTFSKAYGLAGLRVGYGLSQPALAELLNRVRLSFNPGSVGQAAAVAALADREHVARTVELNRRELPRLAAALTALGLGVIPSVCNFVTVDVRHPGRTVFQRLLREGVITRPLDAYGMPMHLRITVGLPEQNERVAAALGRILEQ